MAIRTLFMWDGTGNPDDIQLRTDFIALSDSLIQTTVTNSFTASSLNAIGGGDFEVYVLATTVGRGLTVPFHQLNGGAVLQRLRNTPATVVLCGLQAEAASGQNVFGQLGDFGDQSLGLNVSRLITPNPDGVQLPAYSGGLGAILNSSPWAVGLPNSSGPTTSGNMPNVWVDNELPSGGLQVFRHSTSGFGDPRAWIAIWPRGVPLRSSYGTDELELTHSPAAGLRVYLAASRTGSSGGYRSRSTTYFDVLKSIINKADQVPTPPRPHLYVARQQYLLQGRFGSALEWAGGLSDDSVLEQPNTTGAYDEVDLYAFPSGPGRGGGAGTALDVADAPAAGSVGDTAFEMTRLFASPAAHDRRQSPAESGVITVVPSAAHVDAQGFAGAGTAVNAASPADALNRHNNIAVVRVLVPVVDPGASGQHSLVDLGVGNALTSAVLWVGSEPFDQVRMEVVEADGTSPPAAGASALWSEVVPAARLESTTGPPLGYNAGFHAATFPAVGQTARRTWLRARVERAGATGSTFVGMGHLITQMQPAPPPGTSASGLWRRLGSFWTPLALAGRTSGSWASSVVRRRSGGAWV